MAIRFYVRGQGVTGQSTEFARVVLRLGLCTLGVAGTVYQFDPGQDSTSTLGAGLLAVADARAADLVPNAQRYACKVAAATAGVISAVTQSGAGPLPTVAGSTMDAVSNTPFGAFAGKVRVARGGALGTAQVDVALDGASYVYTFDVPAPSKPTVIGTVDLTGITPSSLDGLTLILGAVTVTFATPASVAAIVAQVDAAAGYSADLVQGKYLRVVKDTAGASSTFTIDAASTADVLLGMSNVAATGSDATVTLPGTGLVVTFPVGTYVVGEIYSFTTTAPRTSLSQIIAALTAAGDDFSLDFGLACVLQTPLDDIDARAYADALDGLIGGWETQTDKRFVVWLIGSPIDGADATLKAALLTHACRHGAIAHRDCWLPSIAPQPMGLLRASAVEQLALRSAQFSFSEDPGNGEFGPLECSLVSADGVTRARNEATAAIKMGTSRGPGFTTLVSKRNKAHFTRGVTRAGSTGLLARFVDLGVARATKAISAVIWVALNRYENKTFDLLPDGTMQEADAAALDTAFNSEMRAKFVPLHFSSFTAQVVRTEKVSDTRNFTLKYVAQIRGQGEDLTGELSIAGTVSAQ